LLIGTTDHLAIGLIFAAAAIPVSLIALVVYRVSIPVLIERMTA